MNHPIETFTEDKELNRYFKIHLASMNAIRVSRSFEDYKDLVKHCSINARVWYKLKLYSLKLEYKNYSQIYDVDDEEFQNEFRMPMIEEYNQVVASNPELSLE